VWGMVSGGLRYAAMSAQCKPPTHTHTQRGKTMALIDDFYRFLAETTDYYDDGDPQLVSSTGVRFDFVESSRDTNRLDLVIRIRDETDHEDLKHPDTWNLVSIWRERLNAFQGAWKSDFQREIEAFIAQNPKARDQRVTKYINGMIEDNLRAYVKSGNEFHSGLERAWMILQYMGFTWKQSKEITNTAIEHIKSGVGPVFNPGEPVKRDRTRYRFFPKRKVGKK
jgi:hypothetical protein